jgi:hypothetical protein
MYQTFSSARALHSAASVGRPYFPRNLDCDPNREDDMTDTTHSPDTSADEMDEGIPVMQQILDNPFLLLFLGIAMPTVLYIVWGVMEIITIPVAK